MQLGSAKRAISANSSGNTQAQKDKAFNAETVRQINRVTHRKASLLPIVDAAQIQKTQSKYSKHSTRR